MIQIILGIKIYHDCISESKGINQILLTFLKYRSKAFIFPRTNQMQLCDRRMNTIKQSITDCVDVRIVIRNRAGMQRINNNLIKGRREGFEL